MKTSYACWSRFPRSAIAIGSLFLLVACSESKQTRIDSGLKRGAEYVGKGDWAKAGVEVRNVLQVDPKNAQAYLISARVSEAQRDIARALGSYTKALELQADLVEAKVGQARIYLLGGDVLKAEKAIAEVLAADANNVGGRTLSAALLVQAGKPAEAENLAKAVIAGQKQPPVDASIVLARLYANDGRKADALGVIERALKDEPRNLDLLQVAAIITGSVPKGDPLATKADGFFKTATQEAPKNNELWRAWAGHHAQRDEIPQAEAVLRAAISAVPKDGKRTQDLLAFLSNRRGVLVAEKEYLLAIAAEPKEMSLRFGLVSLYQGAGRPADAQRVLNEIVSVGQDAASQTQAKTQLAGYDFAAGRQESGLKLVGEVLKVSPRDNAALVLRARAALKSGKPLDAVIDLRTVVKDQPGSAEAVGLLAQAHRAAGEQQLAREVLAEAVKLRPTDSELRLQLVADLAEAKDFRNALAEIDAGLRLAPESVGLYEGKVRLALLQNDRAAAERALVALKTQLPKSTVGYLRLGQFYAQQNRSDAALKEYDAAAALAPKDPVPYAASTGILIGMKRFDDAMARIEARAKVTPGDALHHRMRAEVALAKRDIPAAEKAYNDVIALAPHLPFGYVQLARLLLGQKDVNAALAVLDQGMKAAPEDASLVLIRAELLVGAKRHDEAIAVYEALNKKNPDDDNVANNLAFLLADAKGDRVSAERAVVLAGRFSASSNPGYLDSLGWAHYQLGQHEAAVSVLEKAVALAPTSPVLQMHLGKALVKSGNVARGKQFLKKAIDSKANLPRLEEARAMLAQG